MKTVLYLLFPVALLYHPAAAQQLRFGAKAGANYATFKARNITAPDRRFGFNGGLVARMTFTDDQFWNAQAELLYSAKGAQDKFGLDAAGNRTTYNYRLHYLDLPILAKINADGLTFETGPQLSYLLGVDTNNTGQLFGSARRQDFTSLALGYVVGLGYELPTGLSLTLRYATDVTTSSNPYAGGFITRNSMFQGQLGYLFGAKQ
jgi:hypothetical protein